MTKSGQHLISSVRKARIDMLRTEVEELNRTFALRWKADMRAIKRWREEKPGRNLILPDHADLCVWLLDKLEDAERKLTKLRKK